VKQTKKQRARRLIVAQTTEQTSREKGAKKGERPPRQKNHQIFDSQNYKWPRKITTFKTPLFVMRVHWIHFLVTCYIPMEIYQVSLWSPN
jgi:hypothetical protein